MQGFRRQVCDSEPRPRGKSAPQGTHGPQSANRRGYQDQSQDRGAFARGKGVQRRDFEVVFPRRKFQARKQRRNRIATQASEPKSSKGYAATVPALFSGLKFSSRKNYFKI